MFGTPKGALDEVTAVPNVSVVDAAIVPNAGFENTVVLAVSNCEAAVTKGPAVVEVTPNGEVLEAGIAVGAGCAAPNKFTAGAGAVTPKAFVGCWVLDAPNMPVDAPNAGFSPNIELEAFPNGAPPNTGVPPKAGVSDCELNIPEPKLPVDEGPPKMELVACGAPNAVDVLAPPNMEEALAGWEAPLNKEDEEEDEEDVVPLLNTDVVVWDVWGLAKTLFD